MSQGTITSLAIGVLVLGLVIARQLSTRRLRDFQKISLTPGERRTLRFRLPIQRLAFVGLDNRWIVEPGDFEIMVGGLKAPLVVH